MCALESETGREKEKCQQDGGEWGCAGERWLYLVAPNKATLAFQDERQVYRRKFMRAELQRVELDLREGWRMSWRGTRKEERAWERKSERGEGEWSRFKSTRVESSRVRSSQAPSQLSREGNFVHFHPVGIRPPALSPPALENFARDRDEDNDVEG